MKATSVLVVQSKKGEAIYTISQPNKGRLLHQASLAQIDKKYKKVEPNDAKPLWVDLFASSKTECIHKYWYVNVKVFFSRSVGGGIMLLDVLCCYVADELLLFPSFAVAAAAVVVVAPGRQMRDSSRWQPTRPGDSFSRVFSSNKRNHRLC